jgi:hypothetical protein
MSAAMLMAGERSTGVEAERAPTTAMPKFSWWEGRRKEGLGIGTLGGASHYNHHGGRIPEAFGLEGGNGAENQIRRLLGGDAAEEEEALAAGEGGMGLEEGGGVVVLRVVDALAAVIHHHLVAVVEPEGLAGEAAFLLAGEAHRIGLPQGGVNGPGLDEPFLEVLEGIAVAKPGIQHPVGEHKQGRDAAAQGKGGGEEAKIPDAVCRKRGGATPHLVWWMTPGRTLSGDYTRRQPARTSRLIRG